jgi:dTDP-4-amino-4,6-dideoxygalactose transaminase
MGDGGGIITTNSAIANKIRAIRDYGRVKGQFTMNGRNSRMDEMQAAILRTKLRYLDRWNARRREIAARYNEVLEGPLEAFPSISNNVFYKYVIRMDQNNINSQGSDASIYEVAELLYSVVALEADVWGSSVNLNNLYTLPIGPELTENEITYICQRL